MQLVLEVVFMGVIPGLLVAAEADLAFFRNTKTWSDWREFDWWVASYRWFKGATLGGVTYLIGMNALQMMQTWAGGL